MAWTISDVLVLTQGRAVVDSATAARVLGYSNVNAFLEQLRRRKVAVRYSRRGRRLEFTATALADMLNRKDQESEATPDPDPLPMEGLVRRYGNYKSAAGNSISISEREFLRRLAKRMV